MTTAESLIVSATAEMKETESSRKKQKGLFQELRAMSAAMIEEEGLLNHAQAALVLDISTRRIGELVETGKFTRFEFLGRTYVSVREVVARRQADIKSGRPPRVGVEKIKKAAQLVSKFDLTNLAVGSLVGDLDRAKKRRKK